MQIDSSIHKYIPNYTYMHSFCIMYILVFVPRNIFGSPEALGQKLLTGKIDGWYFRCGMKNRVIKTTKTESCK